MHLDSALTSQLALGQTTAPHPLLLHPHHRLHHHQRPLLYVSQTSCLHMMGHALHAQPPLAVRSKDWTVCAQGENAFINMKVFFALPALQQGCKAIVGRLLCKLVPKVAAAHLCPLRSVPQTRVTAVGGLGGTRQWRLPCCIASWVLMHTAAPEMHLDSRLPGTPLPPRCTH